MEELTNSIIKELLLTPDLGIEYMKHSQHAVVMVNDKGLIVLVNRSAELLFGYHKSEMIGKPVEMLLPDSIKGKHEQHRSGFMKSPRNRPMGVNLDLKAKHKDGTEIPIDINLVPVPNATAGMITIAEISRR